MNFKLTAVFEGDFDLVGVCVVSFVSDTMNPFVSFSRCPFLVVAAVILYVPTGLGRPERPDPVTEGVAEVTVTTVEDAPVNSSPFPLTSFFKDGTSRKWVPPPEIWDRLGFPKEPTPEESQELNSQVELFVSDPDLANYNVDTEDGVIQGTLNCQCGVPLGRIIFPPGRVPESAKINDIPWTVALVWKEAQQPFCGASIINNRYLLTAGHCIRSFQASDIEVWMNDESTLLSHNNTKRQIYGIEELIFHPRYKAYNNDIALVKLNDTVPLGDITQFSLVNAICLPANNEDKFGGRTGVVAGWGVTKPGGEASSKLLKLNVPIFSNEQCINESRYMDNVKDNMMCAGYMEGGADACQGDSGGPLIVYNDKGAATQVGIVSWGLGCAEPFKPGVYARVGVFVEWILENTRDAEWCQAHPVVYSDPDSDSVNNRICTASTRQ